MKLVRQSDEHEVPRGVLGGAEVSQTTTGAHNIRQHAVMESREVRKTSTVPLDQQFMFIREFAPSRQFFHRVTNAKLRRQHQRNR